MHVHLHIEGRGLQTGRPDVMLDAFLHGLHVRNCCELVLKSIRPVKHAPLVVDTMSTHVLRHAGLFCSVQMLAIIHGKHLNKRMTSSMLAGADRSIHKTGSMPAAGSRSSIAKASSGSDQKPCEEVEICEVTERSTAVDSWQGANCLISVFIAGGCKEQVGQYAPCDICDGGGRPIRACIC